MNMIRLGEGGAAVAAPDATFLSTPKFGRRGAGGGRRRRSRRVEQQWRHPTRLPFPPLPNLAGGSPGEDGGGEARGGNNDTWGGDGSTRRGSPPLPDPAAGRPGEGGGDGGGSPLS
uniref:Uncharacterized protein n=1 Tax=Oryza sativa subsp. indica TaxID=39946 RepID=C5NNP9_ORYSI|nr:unknown protein [Oryza sativa Indica Group]